jgi:drug/metabolite transporter (DMT)-like permease
VADPIVPLPPAPVEPGRQVGSSVALVLLGVTCFVVNAGVSRIALTHGVAPTELASVRAAGTTVLLGLAIVLTGNAGLLRLHPGEWPWLLLYGVVGVALLQVAYFAAIARLPIGLALLLEYLAPLLVALWARFVLREPVRAWLWPGLALSLLGLALVAQVGGGGAGLDGLGVLAGLTAAVAFAVYFLVGERLVRRRDPVTTTFWGFAVAAVLWTAAEPWWPVLDRSASATATLPDGLPGELSGAVVPLLAVLAWVVLLGTIVPFAAETAALRHLPATVVTVIATLEPVGAALLAWWWFAESLDALQVVGVGLVVGGVVLGLLARPAAVAPVPQTGQAAAGPAGPAGTGTGVADSTSGSDAPDAVALTDRGPDGPP